MSMLALPFRVSVERRHIKEGAREQCGCCPVALAVREAIGLSNVWDRFSLFQHYDAVKADYEDVVIKGIRYWLPEEVGDWMRTFDCRKKTCHRMPKITFEITEIHPHSAREIAQAASMALISGV